MVVVNIVIKHIKKIKTRKSIFQIIISGDVRCSMKSKTMKIKQVQ